MRNPFDSILSNREPRLATSPSKVSVQRHVLLKYKSDSKTFDWLVGLTAIPEFVGSISLLL